MRKGCWLSAPTKDFERQLLQGRLVEGAFEETQEGGIGSTDGARPIHRGDGDGGGMEQAREAKFRRARLAGFPRRAVEHERISEAAIAAALGEAVQDAHGQARAVGLEEVDVEAAGGERRLTPAGAGDERGRILRHDPVELERRGREFGEIDAEPLGERGVEIIDAAFGIGGKEARRRIVEIGDRLLHLLEARLLALPILGDLVHLPDHERRLAPGAGIGRQGTHLDAEPLRRGLVLGVAWERYAEFFFQRAALLGGARQAEDGLGERRAAGEGTVGRGHRGIGLEPEQAAIGLVGIEHPAGAVGDQRPLRQIVDEGLGDVVTREALAEMQDADGAREQAEHADHGKPGEDREHEGLGHLARHHGEPDGRHREREREQDHEPDAAVPFAPIGCGLDIAHGRLDIRHDTKLSDSIRLRAGHSGAPVLAGSRSDRAPPSPGCKRCPPSHAILAPWLKIC